MTQSADDHIEKTACAGNSGDELSAGDMWLCDKASTDRCGRYFFSVPVQSELTAFSWIGLQHEWSTSKKHRFLVNTVRKACWGRSLKVVSLQPKEAPKRSLGLHSGALFGKVGQLFDEVEPTLFKMGLTRKLFLITLKWYSEQTVFKMYRVLHVKVFFTIFVDIILKNLGSCHVLEMCQTCAHRNMHF